jgi:hypothetical protein
LGCGVVDFFGDHRGGEEAHCTIRGGATLVIIPYLLILKEFFRRRVYGNDHQNAVGEKFTTSQMGSTGST